MVTDDIALKGVLQHQKEFLRNLKPDVIIITGVQQPRPSGEESYLNDDKPHFSDYSSNVLQR